MDALKKLNQAINHLQLAVMDMNRGSLDRLGAARKELVAVIRGVANEAALAATKDTVKSATGIGVGGEAKWMTFPEYLARFDKDINPG